MRIIVTGFAFEANSFAAPRSTDKADIFTLTGQAQHAASWGEPSTLGGYLSYASDHPEFNLDLLGFSQLSPRALIEESTLQDMIEPFLSAIKANPASDAVLLSLHGNAMTRKRYDVDADFVEQIRQIVGPAVPIGVTLDMHANVSPRLVALADIVSVYRTTPHIDMHHRARHTAKLVHAMLRNELEPRKYLVHLPMVATVEHQNTSHSPLADIMRIVENLDQRPDVASLDISLGSAFADSPHLGMSVICTTDGDETLARTTANEIATRLWDVRLALCAMPATVDEAVRHVQQHAAQRSLLIDMGDNIFSGAAGTSLQLFETLERQGIRNVTAPMHLPSLAAAAIRHGIGATMRLDGLETTVYAVPTMAKSEPVAVLKTATGNRIIACPDEGATGGIAAMIAKGIVSPTTRVLLVKGDHRSVIAAADWPETTLWVGTSGETTPLLSTLAYSMRIEPFLPRDAAAAWL